MMSTNDTDIVTARSERCLRTTKHRHEYSRWQSPWHKWRLLRRSAPRNDRTGVIPA
jgi:hypothetical protein